MKYIILAFIVLSLPVLAQNYSLYSPDSYQYSGVNGEKLLFIMDLSNSMNESLENDTKYNLMIKTVKKIIPKISPNSEVGLRVYGHKIGFTPVDACRASSLVAPIAAYNAENIVNSLQKRRPRGMTPITYSLKQAVKYDFMGYLGKKHIILMTDGGENCDESPCSYVMDLIKIRRDVQIDVIAFNIRDYDDLEQLKCTALVTSGKFYDAKTSAQLLDSFNNSIKSSTSVDAKILLPNIK